MAITKNTWTGGLNQDLSKVKLNQTFYDNALNIRLTTDQGRSTGAIVNVRGNEFSLSIPNTSDFIELIPAGTGKGSILTLTFTLGGIVLTWTVPTNFTTADALSQITLLINNDPQIIALGIIAFNSGTSIKIYSTQNINLTGSTSFPSTGTTFTFTVNTIVTNQTNLVPIGFINIREEIILLTTSSSNINPTQNSTTQNVSQIWKLIYDKKKLQTSPSTAFTFTLLYNNTLDFSLSFPIAPSAITGNFENPNIKKIYWCDFQNDMRFFNTADPDGFFISTELLFSNNSQHPSVPILQKVREGRGKLPTGIYQYTYQLISKSGTTTRFYPLGNPLHVVKGSETTDDILAYINNSNDFSITNKSVSILISGIDTNFDRINVAYCIRTKLTNVPDKIAIIGSNIAIGGNSTLNFEHTGTELERIVTLDNLINPALPINQYKTNATKDSMLLIANIKKSTLDLNYDARAFRYNNAGITYAHNALPDIQDDINPNQDPTSYNNYLYQTNGTTLGGSGVNINYSFVNINLPIDYDESISGFVYSGPPYVPGFKNTINTPITTGVTDQSYSNNNTFDTQMSPYLESVTRGWQRDETYRVAIQFFDLSGNPAFSKWIGDIRIPHIFMPDTTQGNPLQRSKQFPVSYLNSRGGIFYTSNIGIRFSVNISSISNLISGFSIVRVKREQKDKTVLAQGLIIPAKTDPFDNSTIRLKEGSPKYSALQYDKQYATLYTPETFFETFGQLNGSSSDYVEIIDVLNNYLGNTQALGDTSAGFVPNSSLLKYFDSPNTTLTPTYINTTGAGSGAIGKQFQIAKTWTVAETYNGTGWITDTLSGGTTYKIGNFSTGNPYTTQGGKTLLMRFNLGISGFTDWQNVGHTMTTGYMDTDNVRNNYRNYLANYKRIVTKQYGGNTLENRSNNEYISCNHYQKVIPGQNLYTGDVYGGDIFVNMFDQNDERTATFKIAANLAATGPTRQTMIEAGFTVANCFLIPKMTICESAINTLLRSKDNRLGYGSTYQTVNSNSYPGADPGAGLDITESMGYNPMFSNENDIERFLPKPIPFISEPVFDHRIYNSDTKIDGELTDSWLLFQPANYKDVDSQYGPITSLAVLNAELYYIQNTGFGLIPVNRRVLQIDPNSGIQTQLGKGDILEKHQYISTKIGSKHQWSILSTDKAIYWYDESSNKQIRFSQNGLELLSDTHGMHSFFDTNVKKDILLNDNPILGKGICSVYDYINNEAIFTFLDGPQGISKTLSYSEQTQTYSSFYSFTPPIYITNKEIIITQDPNNQQDLYVHEYGQYGRFYNNYTDSYVRYLTNEHPETTKVFNNLQLQTEVQDSNLIDTSSNSGFPIQETINKIRVFNDNQDSGLINLSVTTGINIGNTIKRKFRSWRTPIPKDQGNVENVNLNLKARQRDKYLYTELYFTNNNNKRFILHDTITGYLLSPY